MLHGTVWDAPSASLKKKLVLSQKQEQNILHQTEWDAPSASSKMNEIEFKAVSKEDRQVSSLENVQAKCMICLSIKVY